MDLANTYFSLLFYFSASLLFLLRTISAVDTSSPPGGNATDFIRQSCAATLYPQLCYTSLCRYANSVQRSPARLARMAVSVSLSETRRMAVYVSTLSHQAEFEADPRAVAALQDCFTTFGDAVDQIERSLKEMRQLGTGEQFRFHVGNVQTWMSAALTNEDTCTDGFDDVADGPMKSDVCGRVGSVKMLASNALALVNSVANQVGPTSRSP